MFFKKLFSVMEKLPATSYVRLMPFIQVQYSWLLCYLAFIIYKKKVTLTTIVELYNEGDDIVNHHGFQRQVKNGKEVQAKSKVSSE